MDAGPGVTGVAAGESQGSESHVTRGGGGRWHCATGV